MFPEWWLRNVVRYYDPSRRDRGVIPKTWCDHCQNWRHVVFHSSKTGIRHCSHCLKEKSEQNGLAQLDFMVDRDFEVVERQSEVSSFQVKYEVV